MNLLKYLRNSFIVFICFGQLIYANVVLSSDEKDWIKQHPVIHVGGEIDWAPFDFVDDGSYSGIANEYLNLISKKTGLKFEISIDKWNNNLSKIKNHSIDLLPSVYYTEDRSKYMIFSNSYFQMLDYFFVREDLNVHTIDELNGKVVAIPKGYAHGVIIQKEFPQIKILWVDTFSDAIDAVLEYRADILFDTYASITYMLKKMAVNTIIPFKAYRGKEVMKLHMAINEQEPLLADIINKALEDITDSEKNTIYKKWLGNTYISTKFTREEKDWIAKHPVVKIAVDKDWRPFEFIDSNGDYRGLSKDYLKLISQKTGLHFEVVHIDKWVDILEAIKHKDVDLLTAISYSKRREYFVDFSVPYLTYSLALVTYKSDKFFYTLDDFEDKKVGVVDGYLTQKLLKSKYPKIQQIVYPNIQALLDGLDKHEVDAIFDNSVTLAYYMIDGGYTYFIMSAVSDIPKQQVSMGIAKDNQVLLSIIDKTLNQITDKQKKEIYNNWVSFEFARIVDYSLLYKFIVGFILIIVAILWYNRRIERTKRQVITLIENIPLHIVLSDASWSIVDANKRAINSLGISKSDIKHKDMSIFYIDRDNEQRLKNLLEINGIVEKEIVKYNFLHGEPKDMLVSIVPLGFSNKQYLIHMALDITERINKEKELILAKDEALRANEAKSRFLANVTHEIRTPINAIIGFSNILMSKIKDKNQQHYAEHIYKAATKLLSMVNEILDTSKIEANKIHIDKKSTNIYEMLVDIDEMFSMNMAKKDLEFKIHIQDNLPNYVVIDELKVYQVLLNLIGNALKFTKHGYIKLNVKYEKLSKSKMDLIFEVEDSGIGIDITQQQKIFDRFEQTEGQDNKQYGGTGLGLYISKKYALLMDGDILLDSQLGEGSVFRLVLFNVDILEDKREKIKLEQIKLLSHNQLDYHIDLNQLSKEKLDNVKKAYQKAITSKSLIDIEEFKVSLKSIDDTHILAFAKDIEYALEKFDIYQLDILLKEFGKALEKL